MITKWLVRWSQYSGAVKITTVECFDETDKFVMLKPGQRTAKRSSSEAYCASFEEAQGAAVSACNEIIAGAERKLESAETLLKNSREALLNIEQLTAEEVK